MADNRLLPYSAAQFAPYQPGYTDLTGGAYTNPLSVSYPSWMTDAGARGIGNAFTPDTGTDAATQTAVGTDPTFATYAPAPAPVDTSAQQAAVMGGNTMPNGGGGNQPGGGGQYGPNSGSASGNYAGDTGTKPDALGGTSDPLTAGGDIKPGVDMTSTGTSSGPQPDALPGTSDPLTVGGDIKPDIGPGWVDAAPATPAASGGWTNAQPDALPGTSDPLTAGGPPQQVDGGWTDAAPEGDTSSGNGGDASGGSAGGDSSGGGSDSGGNGGDSGSGNNGGNGNFKGGILTKNKLLPDNDDRPQGKDNGIFSGHTGEGILTDKAVKFYGPAIVAKLNRLMVPKSAFR